MCVCVCVVTWLQLFTKLSLYCGPRNGKVAISFVLVIICHVQVLTTFYFLYCISPMCFLCPSLGLFISLFLLLALSLSSFYFLFHWLSSSLPLSHSPSLSIDPNPNPNPPKFKKFATNDSVLVTHPPLGAPVDGASCQIGLTFPK